MLLFYYLLSLGHPDVLYNARVDGNLPYACTQAVDERVYVSWVIP